MVWVNSRVLWFSKLDLGVGWKPIALRTLHYALHRGDAAMVRQTGTPNRSLGGEQESSKLKSRYAASRGEAHMFKPSHIRERHALSLASRSATLANVAFDETLGSASIFAHAVNHHISPKQIGRS